MNEAHEKKSVNEGDVCAWRRWL